MDNVIRPAFGRRAEPAPSVEASPSGNQKVRPFRVYGTAAGHFVGLVRVETGPVSPSLRVVVGLEGGETVSAVAVLPDTPEGETDAQAMGLAILRAPEVVWGVPALPLDV